MKGDKTMTNVFEVETMTDVQKAVDNIQDMKAAIRDIQEQIRHNEKALAIWAIYNMPDVVSVNVRKIQRRLTNR
jgi:predicted patatin/cPLA2 family phospholipase